MGVMVYFWKTCEGLSLGGGVCGGRLEVFGDMGCKRNMR